jgi:hypothetical protein
LGRKGEQVKKRNIEDIELDREEMRLQIDKETLEGFKIDNQIKRAQLQELMLSLPSPKKGNK